MRKFFTLIIMLSMFAFTASAQYYYVPFLHAGQNPKALNTDIEQPGTLGWSNIAGTSANPIWSSTVNLPANFNFLFNGVSVSQYKVSTSGVLTFTTSASTAPTSTNGNLPSVSIPDNSICIWGLAAIGANDIIRHKTFGTAPNRQHWIQFSSYSAPGATGNNYSYWGIVLEESTNDIYIVDQRSTSSSPLSLTLGIQVNGAIATAVTGSPNIGSLAIDPAAVDVPDDNTYYKFTYGTMPANDVEMLKLTYSPNSGSGANVNITGELVNAGSSTISAMTIKYLADGQVKSHALSGLSINAGAKYTFSHSTPFTIPSPGTWPVKVWAELSGDVNHLNDTLSRSITALSFSPTKRILFEEGTGTWCQWCPRGAVFMDSLHKLYPTTAMLVAVHNADPMAVQAYDSEVSSRIAGYPSGLVDRNGEHDPSAFITEYNKRINGYTPCDVNVSTNYNPTTKIVDITVTAHFAAAVSGDFRLGAIVTEDGVTGTTSGYIQKNAYAGGGNGPMGNYHNLPFNVPASMMVYDHVGRALLGGWSGMPGSIPSTVNANSTHTYTFQYEVPPTQNIDKMHFIGVVTDGSTSRVINANQKMLLTGIVNTKKTENFLVNAFPNPSKGITNFEVKMDFMKDDITLEVFDITGRKVFTTNEGRVAGGSKFFNWDAEENIPNGIYQAVIRVGTETVSTKVVLTR